MNSTHARPIRATVVYRWIDIREPFRNHDQGAFVRFLDARSGRWSAVGSLGDVVDLAAGLVEFVLTERPVDLELGVCEQRLQRAGVVELLNWFQIASITE